MNIDCSDCGSDWCDKHVPMTMPTNCPGDDTHPFTVLAEGWGWSECVSAHDWWKFVIWARYPTPGLVQFSFSTDWYYRWFRTYQELNDWFNGAIDIGRDTPALV